MRQFADLQCLATVVIVVNNQQGVVMRKLFLAAMFTLALVGFQGEAKAQFCPGASGTVFTDVPLSDPFCPAITWIAERGVTLGCQDLGGGQLLYCPATERQPHADGAVPQAARERAVPAQLLDGPGDGVERHDVGVLEQPGRSGGSCRSDRPDGRDGPCRSDGSARRARRCGSCRPDGRGRPCRSHRSARHPGRCGSRRPDGRGRSRRSHGPARPRRSGWQDDPERSRGPDRR